MRAIFTGQAGVEHRMVLSNLKKFIVNQQLPIDALEIFFVEKEIEALGFDFISFLESANDKAKEDTWRAAFNNILIKAERSKSPHVFISMHLCFQRLSNFFSPSNWELVKQFRPHKFVTLIDDIYSISSRISRREQAPQRVPTGSYFRLREIAAWRSMEILMTDKLAEHIHPEKPPEEINYVVAVKHPCSMLYRLLFEPSKLIVYASFPITETRSNLDATKEINQFRHTLHEEFTVFDPVTIDEKILQFAYKDQLKADVHDKNFSSIGKTVQLTKQYRWPVHPDSNWSLRAEHETDYPITLDATETQEVAKDIDDHVKLRDYRLIRQSDCLAAYRPLYRGLFSKGVFAEVLYARDTAHKARFFVHHPEDGELRTSPFQGEGITYESTDELIKALRRKQEEKQARLSKEGGVV